MSKEAKIGLLMGLVFIVGIALLLRGVQQNSNQMLEDELAISSDVVAGDSAGVSEGMNLTEAARQLDRPTVSGAGQGGQEVNRQNLQPGGQIVNQSEPGETQWVRYPDLTAMGEGALATADGLNGMVPISDDGIRWEQELPRPVQSQAVSAPRGDLSRALDSLTEPVVGVDPMINGAANRMKTYVVQRGDYLSTIAKKFYGDVEGNRHKNINLIFEANRDKLKSMDDIYEGQTLKIPALVGQSGGAVRISSSRVVNNNSSVSQSEATRIYVVRENDRLWDIAEEKLGSGVRYKEIVKLNNMKDEDRLLVGTKLKLPAK
ncbi:MAG: LysM peptidoglycan-binding domain-containing protein [Sedimentisphaerales bacterium]|nr:LysM peptidoglycan-binding domain-containing protein [Sedimentisphaerales bacterium]